MTNEQRLTKAMGLLSRRGREMSHLELSMWAAIIAGLVVDLGVSIYKHTRTKRPGNSDSREP